MSDDSVSGPDPSPARPPERVDVGQESPDRTSSWWFASAVLIASATIAGIAWLVPDHDRRGTSMATETRGPGAGVASAPRKPSAPVVATTSGSSGAAPPILARDDDVCGLPGVVSDVGRPLAQDPAFAERIRASHQRLAELLALQPDERSHIVAHLLHGMAQAESASADLARSEAEHCAADKDCIAAMDSDGGWTAVATAIRPDTDAIAHAASTTRDPFVYATAFNACHSFQDMPAPAPACQLINAAQWARMDPDNVFAWLHVADDAASRKDVGALDDAMHHVARANVSRIYGNLVPGIVDAAVPADAAEFDAGQMREFGWMATASWSFPPMQTVSSYCAKAVLDDANRLQVCDAVAHRLVDVGSTFIERSVGIAVGGRVGWPADDVAALRRGNRALQSAQLSTGFMDLAPESCRALAKTRTMVLDMARLGEIGAARAAMASSGQSVDATEAEMQDKLAVLATHRPAASAAASAAAPR